MLLELLGRRSPAPAHNVARRILGSAWWAGFTFNVITAYGNGAYSHENLFFGNIPGSAGEMSKLAVLIGAFWLILTGVGSWRVMAGEFGGRRTADDSAHLRGVVPGQAPPASGPLSFEGTPPLNS